MTGFDEALGHGPDGPTYRAPVRPKRSLLDKLRAWAWYRWGWGHRPS